MKLQHHTAFSAVISGILFLVFKSWGLAAANLIAGIFIDLDHFADVIREYGWSFRIRDFFHICHKSQFHRVVLFWHGWEWVVILGTAAWFTGWNVWITGALIGIGHHLVLDTIYNSASPFSYSLLWRWKQGFEFDKIFSNRTKDKYNHRKFFLDKAKIN